MTEEEKKQKQREYQREYQRKLRAKRSDEEREALNTRNRELRKAQIESDPTFLDRENARRRAKYAENPEPILAQNKKYVEQNKDKVDAYKARWAKENPNNSKKAQRTWNQKHPAKKAANTRTQQAKKQQRTPRWLSKEHFEEIERFYDLSRERTKSTGFQWHVDHIIPLNGKDVSGLHVPWNLQVIPATLNWSANNRNVDKTFIYQEA